MGNKIQNKDLCVNGNIIIKMSKNVADEQEMFYAISFLKLIIKALNTNQTGWFYAYVLLLLLLCT